MNRRPLIADALAAPFVAASRHAAAGRAIGLVSPGSRESMTAIVAAYRGVARHAVRVLDGGKPGDLPVERPSVFELVVNVKTAKRLGLTLPLARLPRADEVVE